MNSLFCSFGGREAQEDWDARCLAMAMVKGKKENFKRIDP